MAIRKSDHKSGEMVSTANSDGFHPSVRWNPFETYKKETYKKDLVVKLKITTFEYDSEW